MSLFNRILASIGIGGVKIDTKLDNEEIRVGENVLGVVELHGGNVRQTIDEIYMSLFTSYKKEWNDKSLEKYVVIGKFRLIDTIVVDVNEKKTIPFQFRLPMDVPLTIGRTRIWVQTGADIKSAIDPTDRDFIDIGPSVLMERFLKAVEQLGFLLRNADCIEAPKWAIKRLPFLQKFEFVPVEGPYADIVDELQAVVIQNTEEKLELLLEIERKAKGFSDRIIKAFDLDETKAVFEITKPDLAIITDDLMETISSELK